MELADELDQLEEELMDDYSMGDMDGDDGWGDHDGDIQNGYGFGDDNNDSELENMKESDRREDDEHSSDSEQLNKKD